MSRVQTGVFVLVLTLVSSIILASTMLSRRSDTRADITATKPDPVEKVDVVVDTRTVAQQPLHAATATPRAAPSPSPSSSATGPRIDPNTPSQYLSSYLSGYTPSEIQEDGTQIYENVPFYVRQTDGTMRKQLSTVKIKPVPPAPLVEGERGPAGR